VPEIFIMNNMKSAKNLEVRNLKFDIRIIELAILTATGKRQRIKTFQAFRSFLTLSMKTIPKTKFDDRRVPALFMEVSIAEQ
jgi:hypothetical protein